MTPQDIEQKLKHLAAATVPPHSLVPQVMERVNQAHQPQRGELPPGNADVPVGIFPGNADVRVGILPTIGLRRNLERLRHSPVYRIAAVIAIATSIAVIAIKLYPQRNPLHTTPLVTAHDLSSDVLAVRVLDIRRIDFKSPDTLDTLLRNSSSAPSPEPVIRVADLSRNDLNLY